MADPTTQLAQALATTSANLDAYIEHRAQEIAEERTAEVSADQRPGEWFADLDKSQKPPMWRPCLQLKGGIVTNLDVWFTTAQECVDFIRTSVIGCRMFEEDALR